MIREIARREIMTRARTKLYLGTSLLLFAAPIIGLVLASIFGGSDDAREVTIGSVGALETELIAGLESNPYVELDPTFSTFADAAAAERALIDGDVDVLVGSDELVWESTVDNEISSAVNASVQNQTLLERAAEAGLSPAELGGLLTVEPLEDRFLDEVDSETDAAQFAAATAATIITFMMIQIYGSLVLMGVVEEKSSGVIEVILSQVRPRQLLTGKVLGIGLLALAQIACVLAGFFVGLLVTDGVTIPDSVWSLIPVFVLTVLGGFALYAAVFAVAGSLVSRQEDAQQASLPLIVPLMLGYIGGLGAPPDSLFRKILSFVPFTSPMVLPGRIAADDIAAWEVALSLGLLAVAVWLVLRIGGQVYELMVLRTGTRIGWGDAFRALRT